MTWRLEWVDDAGRVVHSQTFDDAGPARTERERVKGYIASGGIDPDIVDVRLIGPDGQEAARKPKTEGGSFMVMEHGTAEFNDLMKKLDGIQALIKGGATQGEIEAATGRMQALLTKHALTYEMVSEHIGKDDRGRDLEIVETEYEMPRARWAEQLLHVIARNNFGTTIRYVPSGKGPGRMGVIATKEQARVIKAMYDFLWATIDKLTYIEYDAMKRAGTTHGMSQREWGFSFRIGAVDGVARSMREARLTEVNNSNASALVVVLEEQIQAKLEELHPNLSRGTAAKVRTSAYNHGRKVGGNIHLGKQVGGSPTTALR